MLIWGMSDWIIGEHMLISNPAYLTSGPVYQRLVSALEQTDERAK